MKYGEGSMGSSTMARSKIGVFDIEDRAQLAGRTIEKALPEYQVVYATGDGSITSNPTQQMKTYMVSKMQTLVSQGCRVIVVISYALSAQEINTLRASIPIPIIDMRPPGKDAAAQVEGKISIEAVVQAARKANELQRKP